MASLKADFDELIRRIETGREFAHASFEPIFYLVFPPSELLEAKRLMPAWKSKLTNAGWQVETFSIAEEIADILQKAPSAKFGWRPTGKLRSRGNEQMPRWQMR